MPSDPKRPPPKQLLEEMGWVRALAQGLVSDPSAADDLAQETWLSAAKGAPRPEGVTRGWLARVLRNRLLSRSLGDRRRERRELEGARRGEAPSTEELVSRMETQRLLAEAVVKLDEPYRSTVILRYSEGVAPIEIARLLGVPAGTVRSRLKRALEKLREDLDARFEGGREVWSIALAPCVAPKVGSLGPLGQTASVGGTIVMKKVLVAAVVVALAGGSWSLWGRSTPASLEAASGAHSEQPSSSVETGADEEHEENVPAERRIAGAPILGDREETSPEFGSLPGWWLVGRVRGVDVDAPGATSIEVVPASGGRLGPVVRGATPTGAVELSLESIFAHERILPQTLEVDVRRDGYLRERLDLMVDRDQRQRGFITGERVELEIDVTLQRAAGSIQGVVVPPSYREPHEVSVALVNVESVSAGESEPSDLTRCEAGGRFCLTARKPGPHFVVAFLGDGASIRTYYSGGVRPATTRVSISGGPQTLEEPLVLTEGEIIGGAVHGGPGVQVGVRARLPESGLPCPFGDLCFLEGRFELTWSRAVTDGRGEFQIRGLAPQEYEVSGGGFAWKGLPVNSMRTGVDASGWTDPIRVEAPSRSLDLEMGSQAFAFVVVSGGSPVEGASVSITAGAGWSQSILDDSSRIVLSVPTDSRTEVLFSSPGYEDRTVILEPGETPHRGWLPIELKVDTSPAALELRVVGDPARTVEEFRVRLLVDGEDPDPSRRLPGFNSMRTIKRRRDSDCLVINQIPPGLYVVEIKPPERADDSYVLPQSLNVDLTEGGTKTLTLVLAEGGRLRITTGPIEGEKLMFNLLDAYEDEKSFGHGLLVRFSHGVQTRASLRAGTSLTQPFPPGQYTLQVREWKRGAPWRTYPVTLVGGLTLDLHVGEE